MSVERERFVQIPLAEGVIAALAAMAKAHGRRTCREGQAIISQAVARFGFGTIDTPRPRPAYGNGGATSRGGGAARRDPTGGDDFAGRGAANRQRAGMSERAASGGL